jgi:hypothetical protein
MHMNYLLHWATTTVQGEVGVEFDSNVYACPMRTLSQQMQKGMARTQRQGTMLWTWVRGDVGSDTLKATPILNVW